MKKGFTLLELMVVIIIIGVLATLGLTQYSRVIEKSRAAEARQILGGIRSNAASIYMQNNNSCLTCTNANVGIGTDYPSTCTGMTTHYFSYNVTAADTGITGVATRCTSGGKSPVGPAGATVTLTSNFTSTTGSDTWAFSSTYQ